MELIYLELVILVVQPSEELTEDSMSVEEPTGQVEHMEQPVE